MPEVGDVRNADSIPELGRFHGGGHGKPLQYHGQRSLVGYGPYGCKESDRTEVTQQSTAHVFGILTNFWKDALK